MENAWALLAAAVKKRKPTTKAALELEIRSEWKKISTPKLNSLIESMPRRLKAVLAAGGGPTKY